MTDQVEQVVLEVEQDRVADEVTVGVDRDVLLGLARPDEPGFDQLLARALIYRLVTDVVRRVGIPGVELAGRAGQPVTELVLARLASRSPR